MFKTTLIKTVLVGLSIFALFQFSIPLPATASANGSTDEKMHIFVSILPQKFFVEQIGKNIVDVQVMVQPGASPHTYEPKPQQMASLSETKIYFSIGLPFERVWLGKIAAANKKMSIVHTDEGIKKIHMMEHYHHDEESEHKEDIGHDKHHENESGKTDNSHNGEPDPHIWLSPELVIIQAQHILKALKNADPDHASIFDSNYNKFISEVEKLDGELKKIFADKPGVQFMVFHPSWGYFAHTYNLQQLPIEIEGKNPKPSQLQELILRAKKDKISVVFAQPQFSVKSARQIAREINGEVVFADPLAYNWFDNLREVAAKFKSALK